jgi:cobalt-zinc-cadmium efflux system protein
MHAHSHDHPHPHLAAQGLRSAYALGVGLNVAFVVFEATFGFLSDSMALIADAGHNLSDVLGLLLAWGASYLARRAPTGRRTYGLRRSTILAALLNSLILLLTIAAIAWEALGRLGAPHEVAAGTVIRVAALGVVVNALTAALFYSGNRQDLNRRGAYLHMAADAAVSLGVVAGGFAIKATGQHWIDPAISLVIVGVLLWSTWGLAVDALNLALDAVPKGIDPSLVESYLCSLPGVEAVHDLHIWGMSTTEVALTAHLVKPETGDEERLLAALHHDLDARFGIHHSTIQLERPGASYPCRQDLKVCLTPEATLLASSSR